MVSWKGNTFFLQDIWGSPDVFPNGRKAKKGENGAKSSGIGRRMRIVVVGVFTQ